MKKNYCSGQFNKIKIKIYDDSIVEAPFDASRAKCMTHGDQQDVFFESIDTPMR